MERVDLEIRVSVPPLYMSVLFWFWDYGMISLLLGTDRYLGFPPSSDGFCLQKGNWDTELFHFSSSFLLVFGGFNFFHEGDIGWVWNRMELMELMDGLLLMGF